MTAAYYFRTFGKMSVSSQDKKLLLVKRDLPKEELLKNINQYRQRFLGGFTFELPGNYTNLHPEDTLVHSGKFALVLDSNCIYTPAVQVKYKFITDKEYAWIKATVWIYPTCDPKDNPTNVVVLYTHNGEIYDYQAEKMDKLASSMRVGHWNKIEMYTLTPEVRNKNDNLMVYLWHLGKKPVIADDLKVEAFEPK
jgi:hypothetical protein